MHGIFLSVKTVRVNGPARAADQPRRGTGQSKKFGINSEQKEGVSDETVI